MGSPRQPQIAAWVQGTEITGDDPSIVGSSRRGGVVIDEFGD
jgi:hypothetical protein